MRTIAAAVVCWACAGQGGKAHKTHEQLQNGLHEKLLHSRQVARLLLSLKPSTAWHYAGGSHSRDQTTCRSRGRCTQKSLRVPESGISMQADGKGNKDSIEFGKEDSQVEQAVRDESDDQFNDAIERGSSKLEASPDNQKVEVADAVEESSTAEAQDESAPRPGGSGTCTIGIDFGVRRVGIAVSKGYSPLPLKVERMKVADFYSFHRVANEVAKVVEKEWAEQVVVGLPYNSRGEEGQQCEVSRTFARILADVVAPTPVFLWDEAFSSAEASVGMNAGDGARPFQNIDAHAAAVILAKFFVADDEDRDLAPYVAPTITPSEQQKQQKPQIEKAVTSYEDYRRLRAENAAQQAELAKLMPMKLSKKKKKKLKKR